MQKITPFLSTGKHDFYVEDFVEANLFTTLLIKNIAVYWNFKNVTIQLTNARGVKFEFRFEPGYWTFNIIAKRLEEKAIDLVKNNYDNTCKMRSDDFTVDLGKFGKLLGFPEHKKIQRGQRDYDHSDSVVDVNGGLKFLTIACVS